MKKYIILSIAALILMQKVSAQSRFNLGAGYYGQTLTYKGVVLEAEKEFLFTEKASIPIRIDLGTFVQPRYQTGLFLDVSAGFRRYYKPGFFLEESVGVGVIQSFLHSDAVYAPDEDGSFSEGSRRGPLHLMPSLTLGAGYNLTRNSGQQNLIWIRPKISWLYPHKNSSTFNLALQVGFTHTLSDRDQAGSRR